MSVESSDTVSNIAFYRFISIDEPHALASEIRSKCLDLEVLGTILLGNEGINGMLAGGPENIAEFLGWLAEDEHFAEMPVRVSHSDEVPFDKLVVRVKREIVTMRVPDVDVTERTAPHLPPERLRDWIRAGEDMVLVDVRNRYEHALGTFEGAVDPETRAFGEFPDWVRQHREDLEGKKVVMFCTGGIRCEKATSWMLDQGFADVWQLEGGVLNYFDTVSDAHRDWSGELFVFDDRVAVDTDLEPTESTLCLDCGAPVVGGVMPLCDCANPDEDS